MPEGERMPSDAEVSARNVVAIAAGGYVTVRRLREMLSELPDDAVVVQSSDPEGNDFRAFSETGLYWAYAYPDGELGVENMERGPDDDELDGTELYAAVLWPQ